MEFTNDTPFAFQPFVHLDRDGAERLVVVTKATYTFAPDGSLSLADPQDPIRPVDLFHGDPEASSLAAEAELCPPKPATDVIVEGTAIARRPGTRAMDIRVRVGPVRKVVRVFGPRTWKRRLGMASINDPEPFEEVPLTWENAFGGADTSPKDEKHHAGEERNPVGRGFRAKRSQLAWIGEPLPQLESPKQLIESPDDRVDPVGVGAIARHWLPRRTYGGAYDQAWIDERLPLLPVDFDDRFHQCAPPDLVAAGHLAGGEPVELVGLTPEGKVETSLPVARPHVEIAIGENASHPDVVLDTVGIDTKRRTLRLVYKAEVVVHRELLGLRKIHVTRNGGGA